ncbi:hypothetical protein BD626DRAFT_500585 [Schizophyllum amplum]|uniref:Uncharacterized protein n=1 Tax=Schizophyllum amplum TaxID=97359 RepID=A0A550CAI8_9AGAR|nr:hypothetical protein BD626DRAFT_500585 [Auriculariopsis ampla]
MRRAAPAGFTPRPRPPRPLLPFPHPHPRPHLFPCASAFVLFTAPLRALCISPPHHTGVSASPHPTLALTPQHLAQVHAARAPALRISPHCTRQAYPEHARQTRPRAASRLYTVPGTILPRQTLLPSESRGMQYMWMQRCTHVKYCKLMRT